MRCHSGLFPASLFSPLLVLPQRVDAAGRASLDFTDFGATRALTAALLKQDFGVTWWLPDGHLCPPLTGRCNYLLWIEDLLGLLPPQQGSSRAGARGLDVGTGASAIYALLGAAAHGWSFVATDVTDEALYWARRNVDANPQLRHLIEVRDARATPAADMAAPAAHQDGGPTWPVLAGVLRAGEAFSFTCCNPPFFGSLAEAGRNPGTACGGTATEMVCPGGEAAFIARHVAESQLPGVRGAVAWFTTLCGKKATLRAMTDALRLARAPAVRTTCLQQGKTTRWGLAWSWLPQAAATQTKPLPMMELASSPSGLGLPPPRPCARVSFQLRVGPRDAGAPAAVLAALHAACIGHSGTHQGCTCDAAAFTVTGQLDCTTAASGSRPGDGAGQAVKRRKRDPADKAFALLDGDGEPQAVFSASVQRASPASVTVTVQLVGASRDRQAAQQALAVLGRAVQAVLTQQMPAL